MTILTKMTKNPLDLLKKILRAFLRAFFEE